VLVVDGYGRSDVLRDRYQFENGLEEELRALGFFVASAASSNYAQTSQSFASFLNLEYLPSLLTGVTRNVPVRRRYVELISSNRTFSSFKAAGYRIRAYASEYSMIRPAGADETPGPLLPVTDFELSLYESSVFPVLSVGLGLPRGWLPLALHRRQVTWTLDRLKQDLPQAGDPPTLVFAHVLIPHPPFAFEADGTARDTRLAATFADGDHWRASAGNSGETYEDGYVKAVRFLNARIADVVRDITSRGHTRRSVIYILGDHGPGAGLHWEDPASTDIRERLGILFAARFPDGPPPPLYHHISPVNAFRGLLNYVLGTELPLLEDRAFFSRWSKPSVYIDVTDRLRETSGRVAY
jgi:hypothetical protein